MGHTAYNLALVRHSCPSLGPCDNTQQVLPVVAPSLHSRASGTETSKGRCPPMHRSEPLPSDQDCDEDVARLA